MHVCMVVSCYDIINYCKMAEEKSSILGRTSLERRHKISQDIEQKKSDHLKVHFYCKMLCYFSMLSLFSLIFYPR